MSDLLYQRELGARTVTMCAHANLPAFETERDLGKFLGDHPTPTLAKWRCARCGQLHAWTSARYTDSNGGFAGGNDKLPAHVERLLREPGAEVLSRHRRDW
jgi:hypothetical protein